MLFYPYLLYNNVFVKNYTNHKYSIHRCSKSLNTQFIFSFYVVLV